MIKKGGAEQLYADKQYKASIKLAVEKSRGRPSQAPLNAKQLGDFICDMEERLRFLEQVRRTPRSRKTRSLFYLFGFNIVRRL